MTEAVCDGVLQEIPPDKIDYLCDVVFKKDWPSSIHVYNFIKTISKWQLEKPNLAAWLLGGDSILDDGTFIGIMHSELGGCTLVVYTQEESCECLKRALRATVMRVDWAQRPMLEAVLERHVPAVMEALASVGVTTSFYSHSGTYAMSAKAAATICVEVPESVTIAELDTSHMAYIHSVWAHNDIYTTSELEDAVNLNGGLGVFSRRDHLLLAWAMQTHYGGVGVLQVRSGYMQRGYGKLVCKALTKLLGQRGINPHANIMNVNTVSRQLFSSVGYVRVCNINYLTAIKTSSVLV